MQLTKTGVATPLNGYQIQRSLHKLAFKFKGTKAAAQKAIDKLLADAAASFISLKRVGTGGEKLVWSRISFLELLAVCSAYEGYISVTGDDASETYEANFAMELNVDGAIILGNGDYLELNIENSVAGLDIEISTVGHRRKAYSHLRIERTQLAANEFRTIGLINGSQAAKTVLLPNNIVDARFNGLDNQFTADKTDILTQAREKNQLIINHTTGESRVTDWGMFTADSAAMVGDELTSVDVTGANAASSILVVREDS